MRRAWRPVLVGAAVVIAVFTLAKARIFEPSAATGGATSAGDVVHGEQVFATACARCHGEHGEGGAGPALAGSGLDPEEVTTRIREGGGIMPAGLVTGQDEADVAAYVASIAGQ